MNDLFSPGTVGGLTLRNRICRSATNDYAGHKDGTVSETQMEIYRQLAENDVGLIFTGHACVCPDGRNDTRQNGMYDDRFLPGQRALTEMVHAQGGCIVQQLSHAGGKCPPDVIGGTPLGPSAMEYAPGVPARAMDGDEMARVQQAFASAAVRAQRAGYDGVQLHCAHGYLLSEFIDPAWNHRTDEYGGSAENRFRLARETLARVRAAVGGAYPIFLKVHCNLQGQDAGFAQALRDFLNDAAAQGAAAAEVSGFDFAAQPPEARRYYLDAAAALARDTRLPLILVGGLRSREDMQAALDAGMALASAARAFVCQSDFARRMRAGAASVCRGCFGCFRCYQATGKRCVLHR